MPNPAFAPGPTPSRGTAMYGRVPQAVGEQTTAEPAKDWLEALGRTAKTVGTQAATELEQAAGQRQAQQGGFAPAPAPAKPPLRGAEVPVESAPYQPVPQLKPGFAAGGPAPSPPRPMRGPPQMPGIATGEAIDLDPRTAARGLVKRMPTMQRAMQDPAGTVEAASGRSVDDIIDEMRSVQGAENIPQDLTRQEKGQLLLEMGLRIMSGGPGLIQAVGQAGLHTMGTYADMRARKQAEEQARREGRLDVLGAEAEVALSREEAAAKAREPVRMRPGDQLVSPQTGEAVASVPERAKPLSSAGKLRADLEAGRITQEEYDRALKTGDEGTAFMRDTRFIAAAKNIPLEEAVDIKLLSASARSNPEAFEREVYLRLVGKLGVASHDKAAKWAHEARQAFEQDPEAIEVEPASPETQDVEGAGWSIRGVTDDAIAAAREVFGGGSSATAEAPTVTQAVPQEATAPEPLPEARAPKVYDRPTDPAGLVSGRIYRHGGKLYRYDPESDPNRPFEPYSWVE